MMAELYRIPRFRVFGDRGLLMEFGATISPEIHERVRAMTLALENWPLKGILESVASYRAVAIHYDPMEITFPQLREELDRLYNRLEGVEVPLPQLIEIPVCYGGDLGPDLGFVARKNGLTEEQVIQLHSGHEYLVYMIGFTPGFPFLGGLPESLHTPRLESPRKHVPAGSVGIANDQTGIYPIPSPGGWQLIGQTPVKLFDLESDNPFLLSSGNVLKFRPVSREDFDSYVLGKNAMSGERLPEYQKN